MGLFQKEQQMSKIEKVSSWFDISIQYLVIGKPGVKFQFSTGFVYTILKLNAEDVVVCIVIRDLITNLVAFQLDTIIHIIMRINIHC